MAKFDAFKSNNERFLNESETSSQKPSGNFGKKQKLNENTESKQLNIAYDLLGDVLDTLQPFASKNRKFKELWGEVYELRKKF